MSNIRMENGSSKGVFVSKKQTEAIKNTLSGIIDDYMELLCEIANKYSIYSKSKEANERLFDNVKKDLYNFLYQHIDFVSTKQFIVKLNEKALSKFNLNCMFSADKFIDFQKFIQFCQGIIRNNPLVKCVTDIEFKETGFALLLERLFQKPLAEITDKNLVEFDKISVVNVKTWQTTKCSYAELKSKITRRIDDFKKDIVSMDRLEELTFVYDETTKHLVSIKECSVCMTTYENGEKVSRMPCNHCFHRHCIEQWFKPANQQNSNSRNTVPSISRIINMSSLSSDSDDNSDVDGTLLRSPLRSNILDETTTGNATVSEAFSRITLSDFSDDPTNAAAALSSSILNDSTNNRRRTFSEAFSTTSTYSEFSDDFTSGTIAPYNLPEPDANYELPQSVQHFPIVQIPSLNDILGDLADDFTGSDFKQTCPNCRNKCC